MRNQLSDSESKINLTPMLDVVFIMLIFFIVTATFVKEVGLDINPPEPSIKPPETMKVTDILVRIGSNDQLLVLDRLVDVRSIGSHLARLHAQNPEAPVVIPKEGEAEMEVVND